jgi:hypothetical protein
MNWFDELSVALAAKSVPRRTALSNVARVAASAFLFPWASTATAALAQTPPPMRRGAALPATRVRPSLGVPALRPATLPSTTRIGPCTHAFSSRGSGLTYSASSSAGGRALSLTIEQQSIVQRASGGTTLFGGTSTITVTSGGDQVVRIAANLRPTAPGAPASGTVSVTYGAVVRGLSSASLTLDRGTIGGTVGGRRLVPMTARSGVAPEEVRFADARAFPRVELEAGLRDGIAALFARAKTELGSCAPSARGPAPRVPRARRTLVRAVAERHDPAVVAQTSPDYPRTTDQNGFGRDGGGTPDCHACMQNVMVSWTECMLGAGATAFFCPPCAAGAVAGCYSSAAVGTGACYLPTVGGCAEVICPDVGSCDRGYTCCGQICCAAGDVCTNGVCCTAENPLGCGSPRPSCCAPGSTCCGDSCCPAGSVCSADGVCFTCPPGQTNCGGTACCTAGKVCHNGKCCDFLCGDDCCVSGEVCNHQSGTCGFGGVCGGQFCTFTQACRNGRCVNVATAIPSSRPKGSTFVRCPRGLVVCQSPNTDGTVTSVCCPSNRQCCAGVCCTAPNETCCSSGGSLVCNVCIR